MSAVEFISLLITPLGILIFGAAALYYVNHHDLN